jgi:hypothetical protein
MAMSPTPISVASAGLKAQLDLFAPKVHPSLLTVQCRHPLLQNQLRHLRTISSPVIPTVSTLQPNNLSCLTLAVELYPVLP